MVKFSKLMRIGRAQDAFLLADQAELNRLLKDFEQQRLALANWTFRNRIALIAWYLVDREEADATARFLEYALRLDAAFTCGSTQPTLGYNETLYLFWFTIVRELIRRDTRELAGLARVNAVLECLHHRQHGYRHFYSMTLLNSPRARIKWQEPDLHGIDVDYLLRKEKGEESVQDKPKFLKTFIIERDIGGPLPVRNASQARQWVLEMLCEERAGIIWERSFVTEDKVICWVRAESEALIKRWVLSSGYPAARVHCVRDVLDPVSKG